MKSALRDEIIAQQKRGVLLILTGPSGAGKDSVLNTIKAQHPSVTKIITTTSRDPRPGESEGNPYHFVSRDEFERLIGEEKFFEWVEFRGEMYGTQKDTLHQALEQGADVLWRIDVKGVKNIKRKVKEMTKRAVFVFLTAPSVDELEERVTKAEGDKDKRWNPSIVTWEMSQYDDCDYLVVNKESELEQTANSIWSIIETKRREIIP